MPRLCNSQVIACGLSKLNFDMPREEAKLNEQSSSSATLMDCGTGMSVLIPPRLATYSIHTPNLSTSPKSPRSACTTPPSSATADAAFHHGQQAMLQRSFSQIEEQQPRDLNTLSHPPSHCPSSSGIPPQHPCHQPHSPVAQQRSQLDQTAGSAPGPLPSSQERFASPTDTKAKPDLRKTALLRSLLIRTESNAKLLEAAAEVACMDADCDYDPMALSPTPELPEVSCEDDDDDAYGSGIDIMECSSSMYERFTQTTRSSNQQEPDRLLAPGLLQPSPPARGPASSLSLPTSAAGGINSFLWQHQHFEQQSVQQQDAVPGPEADTDLPADRLEQVRAKALAGSRISASELEARPRQQFPTLPHLRSRPGTGMVMRRTSSHI